MTKKLILIIMFLLLSQFTLACKDIYYNTEEIEIIDYIEPYGINSTCNITVYQDNGSGTVILSGIMQQGTGDNVLVYNYTVGLLDEGMYGAAIECNKSTSQFLGECKFEVREKMQIYFFLLGIVAILMVSGWVYRNYLYDIFSGVFIFFFGLMVLIGDIKGLSGNFKYGIGIALALYGLVYIFNGVMWSRENKENKKQVSTRM